MNRISNSILVIFMILLSLLSFTTCQKQQNETTGKGNPGSNSNIDSSKDLYVLPDTLRAVVLFIADTNHSPGGIMSFTIDKSNKMRIVGDFAGLNPGNYRLQIHQWGDCSSPDFSSTGNAFYPGSDSIKKYEVWKFTADNNGNAHFATTATNLRLSGNNSLIGRSVVIVADESTPEGRIVSCGVIGQRL